VGGGAFLSVVAGFRSPLVAILLPVVSLIIIINTNNKLNTIRLLPPRKIGTANRLLGLWPQGLAYGNWQVIKIADTIHQNHHIKIILLSPVAHSPYINIS
jgi:hypothetical protein